MRNRIAGLIAAIAIPLFAVIGLAAPAAAAYETDWAIDSDWFADSSRECYSNAYVSGCVQPSGDFIWLKDDDANGHPVQITWWDADGDREGYCIDNLGTAKAWTTCNKDWPEGHEIGWYVQWYNDGQWWSGPTQTTVV